MSLVVSRLFISRIVLSGEHGSLPLVWDLSFQDETIIEDSNVALQATLMAQGVALGIFPFIQDDIDRGLLKKPFEQEIVPEKSYYILTRPGARQRREIAAVCNWLRQQADEYEKLYPSTLLSGIKPDRDTR